ncbi:MAG TPA: hypothetical protein PLH57_05560, partial [Oligoflexia bacterium]|nr:hypothetical protein [Oligoflexia bacterium]
KERALFLKTIQETVDYVMREMADPETGAFYSAQDADSEGREGAFFVWSKNNFVDILVKNGFSETDSLALANHFGVTEAGNFEHTNETVLWTSPQEALDRHDLVAKARSVLFAERERREKPFRDEKSLTGWNALMISGLVWASLALKRHGDPARANEAHQAAQRAFDFLRTTLSQSSNHLWATAKDGKAKIEGFLDDYAFATTAAIDMARLGHLDAIDLAAQWNETIWKEFLDDTGTGFYFTSSRHERLIARPKTIYDQAIPSGTATTLWNSLLLAELRADSALAAKAEDVLFRLFTPLLNSAHGMAELANASLLWLCSPGVVNFELKELHPFWLVKGNESVDQKKTVCQRQSCVAAPANFSLQEALLRSLK